LPGGESSFKEIHKSAFGILYEIYGDIIIDNIPECVAKKDFRILLNMIKKGINSPECTSVGRLFDGIASILGIRQKINFEGQAAMELEFLTDGIRSDEYYEFEIIKRKDGMLVLDWEKLLKQIIEDKRNKISLNIISIKFHNALVKGIVDIAKSVNEKNVALSGGCFQNKYLLENSIQELRKNGFNVYWNKEVPANDGGISLGQFAYFSYFRKNK
jgi:hydrogenase maturation protein HypF